jgi:hypothetical protein
VDFSLFRVTWLLIGAMLIVDEATVRKSSGVMMVGFAVVAFNLSCLAGSTVVWDLLLSGVIYLPISYLAARKFRSWSIHHLSAKEDEESICELFGQYMQHRQALQSGGPVESAL